jgi:hypothetical protein
LYSEEKSRALVVYGTTVDRMQPFYTRIHRLSIYEPATIHDFPFEVLENCLKYLTPQELVAPRSACRAWYPAATGFIYTRFTLLDDDRESVGRFICGFHLRNIVFGDGNCNIRRLDLRLKDIGGEYISLIALLVAPTLSSLGLCIDGSSNLNPYETLDIFLTQCVLIRNLSLDSFDFGDNLAAITPTIKEGFARLNQLDLLKCVGDILMFIDNTPIPNLQSLKYWSWSPRPDHEDSVIISSFAVNYATLKAVDLLTAFFSSDSLERIAECCTALEKVILRGFGEYYNGFIDRSVFEAISSLPRLKFLQIDGFYIPGDAVSPLARCRELKNLHIWLDFSSLRPILSVIGGQLDSLGSREMNYESVDEIVECCPNLTSLYFVEPSPNKEIQSACERVLKRGLSWLGYVEVDSGIKFLGLVGRDLMGYV